MNYKEEQHAFKQIVDLNGGNIFAAVARIGSDARQLAAKTDNVLMHSEAITYRVTAELPDDLSLRIKYHNRISYKQTLISNVLEHVTESDIKQCVKSSIRASMRKHNLTYLYGSISSKPKQQRIRILTNMIWYQLYSYRKE